MVMMIMMMLVMVMTLMMMIMMMMEMVDIDERVKLDNVSLCKTSIQIVLFGLILSGKHTRPQVEKIEYDLFFTTVIKGCISEYIF